MKTREMILDHKLYYLKKNGYDTIENLQMFYKYNFISKMIQITEWISKIKKHNNKITIIKLALTEQALDDGKKYLNPNMFSGIYRKMYKQYISGSSKLYITIFLQATYINLLTEISLLYGKINNITRKNINNQ